MYIYIYKDQKVLVKEKQIHNTLWQTAVVCIGRTDPDSCSDAMQQHEYLYQNQEH